MIGTLEPADAHDVGGDRRQTHWNPDHRPHAGAEAHQRKDERNQHVGEAATNPGDHNRPGEGAFGGTGVEATGGGHVRHCLDGTRHPDR